MEIGKGNLACDNGERIIATFDVSSDDEEMNKESCIGEIKQSEFNFTDGFGENLEEDIEQIEMLKDEEDAAGGKVVIIKESKESQSSNSFKDYIKICSEMGLIPSWIDFEKFGRFQ